MTDTMTQTTDPIERAKLAATKAEEALGSSDLDHRTDVAGKWIDIAGIWVNIAVNS